MTAPSGGSKMSGSGTGDCVVTLTADTTVTATFSQLPPVADFSGTPATASAPMIVDFTDASVNSPTSWLWDFGDGTTSTEQNPTHLYETTGAYTVSLTATNVSGPNTMTKTTYISADALCANLPARIGLVDYSSIQGAYDLALDTEVIESHGVDFIENLILNRNVSVTLAGGNNCDYTNSTMGSTITGSLTISDGTVTVENIIIQ